MPGYPYKRRTFSSRSMLTSEVFQENREWRLSSPSVEHFKTFLAPVTN